jgi:hypothetical protein
MKSRTLSATAMILLIPVAALALKAQADQVRKDELEARVSLFFRDGGSDGGGETFDDAGA